MRERSMGEMVRDQNPLTMGPEATVQEACAAMHRRGVGAVSCLTGRTPRKSACLKR
jgi:CBS domain-containing protein